LNPALAMRRPKGVIHHSDQAQYTPIEFGNRCRDAGVRPSMGSVQDAYDNAMCERFIDLQPTPSSFLDRVQRHAAIPAHTSMPPCSRPSRTSPPGGPQVGPSLTAAARDARTFAQAGMKDWLRRGPQEQNALRSDTLIPSRQPSTKAGQVHVL
jgi:transposase InsO family protein